MGQIRLVIDERASHLSQAEFDLCFEWGANGVTTLAPICDAIVIVDVLSFSTCVDIATSNGATVYPHRWKDSSAADFAKSLNAFLASSSRESADSYTLSPESMLSLPRGARIVLPSPNGSSLSLASGGSPTYTVCFRNAIAVAEHLARQTELRKIAVIAAGEKWEDGTLRPALEDLLGAGAVLSRLPGSRSPEAELAIYSFARIRSRLPETLRACISGKELIGRGFATDVELAAELNASTSVPLLVHGAYADAVRT